MRYIGEADAKEIIRLHKDEGWMMKDIAKKFAISEATVSNYIHGRTSPRFLKKRGGRAKVAALPVKKVYADPDFREEVFIGLPDDVLFQHVRECNFIG